MSDDEHSGQSKTVTTTDNIEKVHQIILDNRRISVKEMAEAVGISKERIGHIVTEELDMHKLSAR